MIKFSRLSGKTLQELINLAIEELIKSYPIKKRLYLMQQARGSWQQIEDIPNLTAQLEEMANAPSIQSEIQQIEQEFKITEMDGLTNL